MQMATATSEVDPAVWRAIAGATITVPAVNSRVYYFPQGHSDQVSPSPASLPPISPVVPCRVTAVSFFANPDTDEVFAKIRLVPYPRLDEGVQSEESAAGEQMISFAKVLTRSDANNGGGFSVPRFCADSIFPKLDFEADPPVQNITIHDVQGNAWEFRHIFRGTPRRHLFTTGWSKFVNSKVLVAGDSVVFMRNIGSGELFVGIRRGMRYNPGGSVREWFMPESVVEAAKSVEQGMEFEVVCYPRTGWSDFVVGAELVEEAVSRYWTAGMKVKISMETEDPSRVTWYQGTVLAAEYPDTGPWRGSPWKMLEVAWDESDYLQLMKRVSPWQVECVMAPSLPHPPLQPTKKSRIIENLGLQTDGMQDLPFPMLGSSNSLMGNFDPSMMGHYISPAGMQGARQSQFFISSSPNLFSDNTNRTCGLKTFESNMLPKFKTVSTELNIHSSQSDILSPDSQNNVHLFGTEIVGNQGCVSSKAGLSSFQLFGRTIQVKNPGESNSDDTGSAEGIGAIQLEEAESAKRSFDRSFSIPCKDLLAGFEARRKNAPDDDDSFPA